MLPLGPAGTAHGEAGDLAVSFPQPCRGLTSLNLAQFLYNVLRSVSGSCMDLGAERHLGFSPPSLPLWGSLL